MINDLQALMDPILDISRAAGREIMKIYETADFDVETKADNSPLTAADRAAHKTIVAALEALTPDVPILSEEAADIGYDVRSKWDEYWLVDPLDGTKEFIKRNGEFTVNIALIQNGIPVLGAVHVPAQGRDFYGWSGGGAWLCEPDSDVRQINVSRPTQHPIRVVGSRSHRGSSLDAYLERLGDHVMVPMGSSLKICLVAAGMADIYPRLGPTCEWDTAAAQAVVECAGGHVTDVYGNALRYNTKSEFLNPFFLVFGDTDINWAEMADAGDEPAAAVSN
jgi:3'(2'), 5'-bisphosphate nucleotidase